MSLRRTLFIIIISFFCWMTWRVTPTESKDMAVAFVIAVVVLMVIPMDRFDTDSLLKMIDTWRNPKDKGED